MDSGPAPARMTDLLTGRAAGLLVLHPSGTLGIPGAVRVRGIRSAFLSNDPVLEIDGLRFPIRPPFYETEFPPSAFLDLLSPEDIERIEVVNGIAGNAVAGSALANGLLRVTTARAHPGPTRVRVTAGLGLRDDPRDYEPVYFARAVGSASQCTVEAQAAGSCQIEQVFARDAFRDPETSTLGTGFGQRIGVEVRGGTRRLAYDFAARVGREGGIPRLPDSERRRLTAQGMRVTGELEHPSRLDGYGARVNLASELAARFEARFSAALGSQEIWVPRFEERGPYFWPATASADPAATHPWSPAFGDIGPGIHYDNSVDRTARRGLAALDLAWRPGGAFAAWFRGGFGWDRLRDSSHRSAPTPLPDTVIEVRRDRYRNALSNLELGVEASTAPMTRVGGRVALLLQARRERATVSTLEWFRRIPTGVESRQEQELELSTSAAGVVIAGALTFERRLELAGVLRRDWPRYVGRSLGGTLGGAAQLRGFVAGNQGEDGPWLQLLANAGWTTRPFDGSGGTRALFVLPSGTSQPLEPERTRELELGLLGGGWRGRVSVELVHYRQKTSQGIAPTFVITPIGLLPSLGNALDVTNRGWEIAASIAPIRRPSLEWSLYVNAFTNANRASNLSAPPSFGSGISLGEGEPLTAIYGYRGITFDDQDGNGVLTSAEVRPAAPPGFNRPFLAPRGAAVGSELLLLHRHLRVGALLEHRGGFGSTDLIPYFLRVTAKNTKGLNVAGTPLEEQARELVPLNGVPVQDADFTRLREAWVSVDLGARVSRWLRAGRTSITVTGTNLLTWTDFTGWDPEVQVLGAEFFDRRASIGYGALNTPIPRTFSVRLAVAW